MDVLVYVAISVGVLSGVWAWMAAVFGMVSWTGFVGWTSYYSSKDFLDLFAQMQQELFTPCLL